MSKFSVAMKRFGGFLKRNAFYFLIVLCIASVATVIALAVTRTTVTQDPSISVDDNPTLQPEDPGEQNPGEQDPGEQKPSEPQKAPFSLKSPCNGTVKVEYAHDELILSSTFGHWATHTGLDFVSDDLNVFAAADGAVSDIGYDDLNGNYIAITHEDGYKTIYKSLESMPSLKVGDSVKQGQLIGKMSDSQGDEINEGAHLHFEVWKDNEAINPLDLMVLEEK